MIDRIGQDIFRQIVSTWRFLHVGLFLDTMMKNNTIPNLQSFSFNDYKFEADAIETSWPTKFVGKSGESYFGSYIFFCQPEKYYLALLKVLDRKILTLFWFFKILWRRS